MARIDTLKSHIASVRSLVFDLLNQSGMAASERDYAFNLMAQVGLLTKEFSTIKSDKTARQIEHDRIRPLLSDIRRFTRRHHLTLAKPLWGWPPIQMDSSGITYTGADDLSALISNICHKLGLNLKIGNAAWGTGQRLWNGLREAPIGLFDLRRREPSQTATTAYGLGFALVLGISPVVIIDKESVLPFDIDIEPVCLDGSDSDAQLLAESIDRAFFNFTRIGAHNSVNDTLFKLADLLTGQDATTRVMKRRIMDGKVSDPMEASAVAETLLSEQKDLELAILRPMWPCFYPDPLAYRCFHIMPFSQEWSNKARELVSQSCDEHDVLYRRGDESDENRIIRAIWKEICRANHVVVDITGLNVNVFLELGLVHALGRHTLILHRKDEPFELFPEISKVQVKLYDEDNIGKILGRFIRSDNSLQKK
jgi:hypothetical protein